MNSQEILNTAANAGRLILENGGGTEAAEKTVNNMAKAFGMKEAESFATPTGIMTSVTDYEGRTLAAVKRITRRVINLEKVSRINSLCWKVQKKKTNAETAKDELELIDRLKNYPLIMITLLSGSAAGFFTLFFKGAYTDFIYGFAAGCIIQLISKLLENIQITDFFTNLLGGFAASSLAILFYHLELTQKPDAVIAGSIMLLVPGLITVNAVRDTIAGDLVAGISRGVEAVIVAAAIAIGTAIPLHLWKDIMGGSL